VALPLVLIGAGQGLAFAPLTGAGIADVDPPDAGAASGLVNAAHQLGGALGLGVLVTLAHAARTGSTPVEQLASSTTAALTGSAVLLSLALAVVVTCILRTPSRKPSPSTAPTAAASLPVAPGDCPWPIASATRRTVMEIKPRQPTVKTPDQMFTGDAWFSTSSQGQPPSRVRVNVVRFTPGARNAWHAHVNGQDAARHRRSWAHPVPG
jgi:hypothetical protein